MGLVVNLPPPPKPGTTVSPNMPKPQIDLTEAVKYFKRIIFGWDQKPENCQLNVGYVPK